MKPARMLLYIDRAFRLPYRITEMIFVRWREITSKETDHVLVIKFFGMGSIIRLASLLREHNIDKTKVVLVTFSGNSEVCDILGFQYIIIRTSGIFLFIKDCLNAFFTVKKLNPCLIVDYERCSNMVSIYHTLLAWIAKCETISFESGRSLRSAKRTIHRVEDNNQEQLFLRGIERMPRSVHKIPPTAVESKPYKIVVNINSSNLLPERKYPIEFFAEAIKIIYQEKNDTRFYFTGSASERGYVDQLIGRLEKYPVFNVAGKWNLNDLIGELAACVLFITGDSGPLHLAAYMNVPTLSLWGPTQASHFGYKEAPTFFPLSLHLGCSPCFFHPSSRPGLFCEGTIDCMKNLSPGLVAQKALLLLSGLPASRSINFPEKWKTDYQSKPEQYLV